MLTPVALLFAVSFAQPAPLQIRYVANAGVMLTLDGQKVLIDAPIREGIEPYATPSADERQRLEHATAPYDNVSAILVTHWHEDHFSAEATAEHLRHDSRAVLISSREVVERVRKVAPELPATRFRGVTPPPGESHLVPVGTLKIHVLRAKHNPVRRWPEEHVVFVVQGSRSVIHTGDAALEPDAFVTKAALPPIDLAIVPFWHLTNDVNRTQTIEGRMRAGSALGMHLPQADGPKVQQQLDEKKVAATLLVVPATDVPLSRKDQPKRVTRVRGRQGA